MPEEQNKAKRMGRPAVYGEQIDFEMRRWSRDIIEKVDAKRDGKSRRAYIEHLLRTHPEMQEGSA